MILRITEITEHPPAVRARLVRDREPLLPRRAYLQRPDPGRPPFAQGKQERDTAYSPILQALEDNYRHLSPAEKRVERSFPSLAFSRSQELTSFRRLPPEAGQT